METKHTPGPWTAENHMNGTATLTAADGQKIAQIIKYDTQGIYSVGYNINLIAAAPELLEALKEILDCMKDSLAADCKTISEQWLKKHFANIYRTQDILDNAKAAIAKAEGK